MIIGGSKELMKIRMNSGQIDLEKMQSHEVFGMYLIGEISGSVLKDILKINQETLARMVKETCDVVYQYSKKDESEVEIDL